MEVLVSIVSRRKRRDGGKINTRKYFHLSSLAVLQWLLTEEGKEEQPAGGVPSGIPRGPTPTRWNWPPNAPILSPTQNPKQVDWQVPVSHQGKRGKSSLAGLTSGHNPSGPRRLQGNETVELFLYHLAEWLQQPRPGIDTSWLENPRKVRDSVHVRGTGCISATLTYLNFYMQCRVGCVPWYRTCLPP